MHWKLLLNCLKTTKGIDLQDANEIQLEGYGTVLRYDYSNML